MFPSMIVSSVTLICDKHSQLRKFQLGARIVAAVSIRMTDILGYAVPVCKILHPKIMWKLGMSP